MKQITGHVISSREEDKAETWKALNKPPFKEPMDAAYYYCPYIPLIINGTVSSPSTKVQFKTRYGITTS